MAQVSGQGPVHGYASESSGVSNVTSRDSMDSMSSKETLVSSHAGRQAEQSGRPSGSLLGRVLVFLRVGWGQP